MSVKAKRIKNWDVGGKSNNCSTAVKLTASSEIPPPPPPTLRVIPLTSDPFTKGEWIFFALIGVAAIITRLISLGNHGFWIDEILTMQDAGAILNPQFYKQPHWLSFILVRASMELFGNSEFAVRLPSALAGILLIPALYLLARKLLGIPVAVATVILVLLSPLQIHHSQEARYYAEVSLLTTVVLLVSIQNVKRERVHWVVMLAISCIALFGIHAATGIFIAAILLTITVMMIWYRRYESLFYHIRYSWKYRLGTLLAALVLFVGLFILWKFVEGFAVKALKNILHVSELNRTRGVSFSRGFFSSTWSAFPSLYGQTKSPWAWYGYLGLMILGHIYCFRRRRGWAPVIYWIVYVLSALALFLLPFSIPYTPKYLVFLYPLYIMLVGAGICQVSEWLLKIRPVQAHYQSRLITMTSIFTIIVSAVYLPDVTRVLTMEIDPSKKTMEFLSHNARKSDLVLTSGFTGTLTHYSPQFDLNKESFVRFEAFNESSMGQTVNKYIGQNRNIWFVLWSPVGSNLDFDNARDQLSSMFFKEAQFDSYITDKWRQEIYKLDQTIPFIGSKSTFIRFNDESQLPFIGNKSAGFTQTLSANLVKIYNSNRIEYSFDVKSLLPRDYVFSAWFDNQDSVQSIGLSTSDIETTMSINADIPELQWISAPVPLDVSKHRVTLNIEWATDIRSDNMPRGGIVITNGSPVHRVHRPDNYYSKSHYLNPTIKNKNEMSYLQINRSGFLQYSFNIFSSGDYDLIISALNDVPPPVLLQMDINEKFHNFLKFDKGTGEFTSQSIRLHGVEIGDIDITLHFLNSIYGRDDANIERVLGLGSIQLTKVDDSNPAPSVIKNAQLFDPELTSIDSSICIDGQLSPRWELAKSTKADIADDNSITIQVEPYEDMERGVVSLPMKQVDKLGGLYVSGEFKIDHMLNHSVNILFGLFTQNGEQLYTQYVFPTGYMMTEGWEKFAAYVGLPGEINNKSVDLIVVAILAYPNSTQPGDSAEFFSIRNFSLSPR